MDRVRMLDPKPDAAVVNETLRPAMDLLPPLHDASIASTWAVDGDGTPDGVPGIGRGVLAAGFSGDGFGIRWGAGHRISDLIPVGAPLFDPRP
jgi:glycine/D-amino acid oxidase-like deaminating enzyme